jgi:hypothetical protein
VPFDAVPKALDLLGSRGTRGKLVARP